MKKFSVFFAFCCFAIATFAQSSILVIDDATEYKIALTSKTIDLPSPCSKLTLNAKHSASSTTADKEKHGYLKIEQNVNGTWETLYEDNPGIVTTEDIKLPVVGTVVGQKEASVAYEQLTLNLNYRATQLRFSRKIVGLNYVPSEKQIKDIKAYMATFVEMQPKMVDFGEMVVWSEPAERTYNVEFCNITGLTMSSNNPDFVLSATAVNSAFGQYETTPFTVTFTPNIMGVHEATIVVTNGTYTDSIHCRAKVTKRTPILAWDTEVPSMLTVGDTIDMPIVSDCNNLMVFSTCNDEVEILCGKLIAKKPGVGTIEAVQLGDDDYWNNKVEEFNVTIAPAPSEPTAIAPLQSAAGAEYVLRNGVLFVKTSDGEYMLDGKKM